MANMNTWVQAWNVPERGFRPCASVVFLQVCEACCVLFGGSVPVPNHHCWCAIRGSQRRPFTWISCGPVIRLRRLDFAGCSQVCHPARCPLQQCFIRLQNASSMVFHGIVAMFCVPQPGYALSSTLLEAVPTCGASSRVCSGPVLLVAVIGGLCSSRLTTRDTSLPPSPPPPLKKKEYTYTQAGRREGYPQCAFHSPSSL